MRCVRWMLTSAAVAVVAVGCGQRETGQVAQDPSVSEKPPASQDAQVDDDLPDARGDSHEQVDGQANVGQAPQPAEGPEENQQPRDTEDSQGQGDEETEPEEEPLLLLDEEPLLLLDDDGDDDLPPPTGPVADNSRCHVCHVNYEEEEIAVLHARANIGCADCHGECDEHIADESWASGGNGTAPELMYPREKINPFCLDCHPKEEINEEEHEALFAGTSEEKYCTDCHGEHRLKDRKCKWK